jgi:hypothetical protein
MNVTSGFVFFSFGGVFLWCFEERASGNCCVRFWSAVRSLEYVITLWTEFR